MHKDQLAPDPFPPLWPMYALIFPFCGLSLNLSSYYSSSHKTLEKKEEELTSEEDEEKEEEEKEEEEEEEYDEEEHEEVKGTSFYPQFFSFALISSGDLNSVHQRCSLQKVGGPKEIVPPKDSILHFIYL